MSTMTADSEAFLEAARAAVQMATDKHRLAVSDADRTLAYYLRGAIAHGLTIDEVCELGHLDRDEVLRLIDPAGAH